jgi:hypothetical protein
MILSVSTTTMRRHIDESTNKIMATIALRSTVGPKKMADYLALLCRRCTPSFARHASLAKLC